MKTTKVLGILGLAGVLVSSQACMILTPIAAGINAGAKGLFLATPGSEPNDTLGGWWDDMENDFHKSWRAMGRDIKRTHRTFDRVFLNYDWEDPYL